MPSFGTILGVSLMLLALSGGALGTYHNIRNAQGPRERSYAIRMMAASWLLVLSMLVALYLTGGRSRYYVLGLYFVLCPLLIYKWSTTLQLIRMLDQRDREEEKGSG